MSGPCPHFPPAEDRCRPPRPARHPRCTRWRCRTRDPGRLSRRRRPHGRCSFAHGMALALWEDDSPVCARGRPARKLRKVDIPHPVKKHVNRRRMPCLRRKEDTWGTSICLRPDRRDEFRSGGNRSTFACVQVGSPVKRQALTRRFFRSPDLVRTGNGPRWMIGAGRRYELGRGG